MACHQRLRTAYKEGQLWAWHTIITFGQHRRSDDVGRCMPSPPLDSTHGRMTSGVACHHCPWTAHTVGQRRAWYEITALGQHTRSNDIGRNMPSPPLDSTHSRTKSGVACYHLLWAAQTMSGVACHHRPWTTHTVGRRRAWYEITTLGLHAWSDYSEPGMTSQPLDSTHSRKTRGMA